MSPFFLTIFLRFNTKLFKEMVNIPISTNCPQLLLDADLFFLNFQFLHFLFLFFARKETLWFKYRNMKFSAALS